jgi:hypothetical protein
MHFACADAGTDCALGEIFSLDLPAGIDTVSIEVISKHNLTGGIQMNGSYYCLQTTAENATYQLQFQDVPAACVCINFSRNHRHDCHMVIQQLKLDMVYSYARPISAASPT